MPGHTGDLVIELCLAQRACKLNQERIGDFTLSKLAIKSALSFAASPAERKAPTHNLLGHRPN